MVIHRILYIMVEEWVSECLDSDDGKGICTVVQELLSYVRRALARK